MSAIAGIVCLNKDERISGDDLIPMLEAMRPSIPSEHEIHVLPECSAVLGRLAYGPDTGSISKQSESNNEHLVLLVGELYNDEISRHNDSGRLLREIYRQYGLKDFARELNGSFSAVIADLNDQSVILVSDHVNSCMLFTAIYESKFYFASEVKGIIAVKGFPCDPSQSGIISLATSGMIPRPHTLVKGVEKMNNATVCRIKEGKIINHQYWKYEICPESDRGHKYYISNISDILRQTVKRRIRQGKVSISLSGGYDTRGILSCINEHDKLSAVTFSSRTLQTRHKLGDWAIAEIIAEKLGINLSIFQVDGNDFTSALQESIYCSDGTAGFVCENIWPNVRRACQSEYLLLGDQCMLWGVSRMSPINHLLKYGIHLHSLNKLDILQSCMRNDKLDTFITLSQSDQDLVISKCKSHTSWDAFYELYLNYRMIDSILAKRNIISRHGLFVRNPWLDLDLLNFVRVLPVRYRKNKFLFNQAVTAMHPELFRIPFARDGEHINYQPYFVAAEEHSQGVTKLIFDNNPLLEEYFNKSALYSLIKSVCNSTSTRNLSKFSNLSNFLPISLSLQMKKLIRRFYKPAPQLFGAELLLRVATVAVALRHISDLAHRD